MTRYNFAYHPNPFFGAEPVPFQHETGSWVQFKDVESAIAEARADERNKVKRSNQKELPYLMVADLLDLPLSDPYARAFRAVVDAINTLGDAVKELRGMK